MLLITIVAYTILTGLTAFSPNAETFVVLQFLARAFAVAETILAMVVIVEEFPAEHRGWGVGAAGAIQACGGGFAALLFGFVDVLPYGLARAVSGRAGAADAGRVLAQDASGN
jgi:MFS family permease